VLFSQIDAPNMGPRAPKLLPQTNSIMSASETKPQTTKELAQAYGVSSRTMIKWLTPFQERIGQRMGHTYTPKQVRTIYEALGWPNGEPSDEK
jgi:hypothetical protein